MNTLEKKYFDLSYELLGKWITPSYEELFNRYSKYPQEYTLEEMNGFYYFLFCYPLVTIDENELLEQGILLVYKDETVIADLAFMHGSCENVMKSEEVFDYISKESDWSYLEHYTFANLAFILEYPYCYSDKKENFEGEVTFFTNAYVTKSYRRQNIFSNMLQLSKEQVLRYVDNECTYYATFSLDPDIACYGPDTQKEPYIYSMKDEADRMRNKEILEHKGYFCLKLEEEKPDRNSDGTKLWFGVLKEKEKIVINDIKN